MKSYSQKLKLFIAYSAVNSSNLNTKDEGLSFIDPLGIAACPDDLVHEWKSLAVPHGFPCIIGNKG